MKRFIFYNLLIIIGFLAGCKKIELEPIDGEPVFTAEFKIDGNRHVWEAGNEGYYMFSSFQKDTYDIFVFNGKIQQEDTTKCCTNTLEFLIRDAMQTSSEFIEINAAISTDIDYVFADYSRNDSTIIVLYDTSWLTTFNVISFAQPQQPLMYKWEFGDAQADSALIDSIIHSYDFLPDDREVTLIASSLNQNCSSYFTRKLSSSNNPISNCNLAISLDNITNNNVQLTASFTGTAPFSYLWSDGSTNSVFQADSSSFGSGPLNISLIVTDAQGCSVSAGLSTTITPGTVPPVCVAGFDYDIQQMVELDSQTIIEIPDSLQFSAITIVYKDELGIEYRSDRQQQSPSASFEIIDVEDYDLNKKGQKTKKISLLYDCRVWDEQGNFIDLTEGKATIAIAYP